MKNFLESCKKRSKLSVDVFLGRWDIMVAQRSNSKIFFFEKVANQRLPPLLTYLRDITQVGNQGG